MTSPNWVCQWGSGCEYQNGFILDRKDIYYMSKAQGFKK